MLRGLYTGYTGMRAQLERMDTISNNLANVDTVGFKKDQVILSSFKEVLTYKLNDPEVPHSKNIGTMSLGVKVDEIHTDHLQGSMKQTDQHLDIALQGQGMMIVGELLEDGTMVEKYTRDGSLKIDQQGRLVTGDGLFVLNTDSEVITLDRMDVRINKDGSIYSRETFMGKIKVVGIEDAKTLRKQGSSLYIGTEDTVETAFEGSVEQGFLESSNANTIVEMVNMISVMRSYETNQKVIQTYDATLEKAVNNVGAVR